MTKMIKMSLVAAVAVAGLTTTSSAASLEEAIKGVDVSGYVRYRLNNQHEAGNAVQGADATEEAKLVAKLGTKVNDNVKANLKFVAEAKTENAGATQTTTTTTADDGTTSASNTNTNGATVAPVNLTEANFVISAGPVTAIAGLQTTASPFFANNGDTRAHGLTALVAAGPATVAAAHYTTVTVGPIVDDISALGVIAKAGPANVEAWYGMGHSGLTKVSTIALIASAKVGPATVSLHHAEKDTGAATNDENTNTQLTVSAKAGPATVTVAYAATGKDSGDATLDGDTDGRLIFGGAEAFSTKVADMSAIVLAASAPVGPVNLGLQYVTVSGTNDGTSAAPTAGTTGDSVKEASELKLSVAYAMSKNFNVSAFYATGETTDTTVAADTASSRIEVKYTF